MDFGDILNQWDNQQKDAARKQKESGRSQISHKKANAPTKEEKEALRAKSDDAIFAENSKKINPMEFWLRRYGTVDKDKIADEQAEHIRENSRSYLVDMKVEARLDLHGLTREEAWDRLKTFVNDCQRRGVRKIMIIHGKGIHTTGSDPVLGEVVRKFIEEDEHMGLSGHPDRKYGGNGATWVILK